MHSRKAVCTTGRWRLSVHNTASTLDRHNNMHMMSDRTSLTLTTVCMARGYIWTDEWHVTTSANGVSISRRVIESHRGEVVSPPSIMLLLLPCSTLSNSIAS
jgi:hypothetical protein